jgi:hypothetical protein
MNEIVTRVNAPDEAALTLDAQQALEVANGVVIDSPDMLTIVAAELQEIKSKAKRLEEQRVTITKPLLAAKKAVDDLFRRPLEYLAQAEAAYKGAITRYTRAQEEERRRLQAEADARARKERERLEALAAKQAAAGKEEKAVETLARAEATALMQPVIAEAPKAAGISTRRLYRAQVVDKAALLAFVVQTPAFANLVVVDESALNALARAQKDGFALPGCKLVVEDSVSARAA